MMNQRTLSEVRRRPIILHANDAYSLSATSEYTQNIAYKRSHRSPREDQDDPSITYCYSTFSAGNYLPNSQSPTQGSSPCPNDEGVTLSSTPHSKGNYTENVAYKCRSNPESDNIYYDAAYRVNYQGTECGANIAYGAFLEDSVPVSREPTDDDKGEEEEESNDVIPPYCDTDDKLAS